MVEYFSFINLLLWFLFIFIGLLFIVITSTLLYYSTVNFNLILVEFMSTLFSFLFLMIIISPAVIILFSFDVIMIPSFILYSLGLQWFWHCHIMLMLSPQHIGISFDHYMMSSIRLFFYFIMHFIEYEDVILFKVPFYLFDISQYILLPMYSFIRLLISSFDVIHSLGFYSWGIKIDAIPGRIN